MPELTIKDAARVLGVSHSTMKRWIAERQVKARQDDRGWWYVDVEDAQPTPSSARPRADGAAVLQTKVHHLELHIQDLKDSLRGCRDQLEWTKSLVDKLAAGQPSPSPKAKAV